MAEHGRWRVGLVAVVAAGCTLVALSALAARSGGAPSGARLTFSVRVEYGAGGTGAVVSPYALCEANPDGTDATRLSDRTGDFGEVAWNRDGSRLALIIRDPAAQRSLLQVVEGGGWRPRTLARAAAGLWDPAWSPDGLRIAFASSSGKAPGIYVIGADARDERRLTRGYALYPTWSTDGSRIAYGRIRGIPGFTGWPDRISIVNVGGGGETTFSSDGGAPAWSPDGSRIAFTAPRTPQGADEIFVAAADGSGRTQLTHLWGGHASPSSAAVGRPSWSPDGTQLAFDRSRPETVGHVEVWTTDAVVVPVAGGEPRALALPDLYVLFGWRPAPPLRAADAAARPCTLHGRKRGGALRGSSLDDLILGSERRDVIHGGPGNDWIEGGSGNDVLDGGPGRDDLRPGPGTDRVVARDGERDTIHCGDLGQDTVIADRVDLTQGSCRRVERYAVTRSGHDARHGASTRRS